MSSRYDYGHGGGGDVVSSMFRDFGFSEFKFHNVREMNRKHRFYEQAEDIEDNEEENDFDIVIDDCGNIFQKGKNKRKNGPPRNNSQNQRKGHENTSNRRPEDEFVNIFMDSGNTQKTYRGSRRMRNPFATIFDDPRFEILFDAKRVDFGKMMGGSRRNNKAKKNATGGSHVNNHSLNMGSNSEHNTDKRDHIPKKKAHNNLHKGFNDNPTQSIKNGNGNKNSNPVGRNDNPKNGKQQQNNNNYNYKSRPEKQKNKQD